MVRKLLENAIQSGCGITITYSKDGDKTNQFHLNHVEYHPQYGNNYIVGKCKEKDSELTFKIDKIIDADIEWIDVFPQNSCANQDGLFLVACRSDMHLEYELRQYKKGDNILEPYKKTDGIKSSYYGEDVLAYHYIPYYTEVENRNWFPIELDLKEEKICFGTFAYKLNGEKIEDFDEEDDYTKEFIIPSIYKLCNTESDGIYYTVEFIKIPINEKVGSDNIEQLAIHFCRIYNEDDHSNHWDLARKLGLIK